MELNVSWFTPVHSGDCDGVPLWSLWPMSVWILGASKASFSVRKQLPSSSLHCTEAFGPYLSTFTQLSSLSPSAHQLFLHAWYILLCKYIYFSLSCRILVDNPFKCSCEIMWIKKFQETKFYTEAQDIYCVDDSNKRIALMDMKVPNCGNTLLTYVYC